MSLNHYTCKRHCQQCGNDTNVKLTLMEKVGIAVHCLDCGSRYLLEYFR